MNEIENIYLQIDGFGSYQIRTFMLVNLLEFWAAMAMMLPVFTGAKPDMVCGVEGNEQNASVRHGVWEPSYLHLNASRNLTKDVCWGPNSICPGLQYSEEFSSIVTEWDLICDMAFVSDLITTIQMVGVMVGAFVCGQLADVFGRKKTLFGVYILMIVFGFVSGFSSHWPVYAVMRFLTGAALGGLLVVSFIVPMEIISPGWRNLCGCLGVWGLGVACLALLAYLLRDWRHLSMASTAPGLIVLLSWWWIPESPRWLVMQNRMQEACDVIRAMAKCNKKPVPDLSGLSAYAKKEREHQKAIRAYSYWHLFKTRKMAKITLLAMYAWFTCTAVYYGINLNMKNLSGDRYVNIFLTGIVEIPALLFVFFINNKAGRRYTSSGLMLTGTAAMFTILALDISGKLNELPGLTIAIVIFGKGAISGGWAATMIFSAESFPTVARNIGYAACSVSGRIGGILAPQIVFLNEVHTALPYILFGCLGVFCCVGVLFIPETNKTPLADAFKNEDSENRTVEMEALKNSEI